VRRRTYGDAKTVVGAPSARLGGSEIIGGGVSPSASAAVVFVKLCKKVVTVWGLCAVRGDRRRPARVLWRGRGPVGLTYAIAMIVLVYFVPNGVWGGLARLLAMRNTNKEDGSKTNPSGHVSP